MSVAEHMNEALWENCVRAHQRFVHDVVAFHTTLLPAAAACSTYA